MEHAVCWFPACRLLGSFTFLPFSVCLFASFSSSFLQTPPFWHSKGNNGVHPCDFGGDSALPSALHSFRLGIPDLIAMGFLEGGALEGAGALEGFGGPEMAFCRARSFLGVGSESR